MECLNILSNSKKGSLVTVFKIKEQTVEKENKNGTPLLNLYFQTSIYILIIQCKFNFEELKCDSPNLVYTVLVLQRFKKGDHLLCFMSLWLPTSLSRVLMIFACENLLNNII